MVDSTDSVLATAPVTPAAAPAPLGTKASKEVLDLLLALGKAFVDAEADGKISYSDVGLLLGVFPKVGPAFADAGAALKEIESLDASEAEELVAYVMAGLVVESVKAQAIVAASLKTAVGLFALVKAIRS